MSFQNRIGEWDLIFQRLWLLVALWKMLEQGDKEIRKIKWFNSNSNYLSQILKLHVVLFKWEMIQANKGKICKRTGSLILFLISWAFLVF
jgi:hypothetical protein